MNRTLGTDTTGLIRALLDDVTPATTQRARLAQLADALPTLTRAQAWLILAVYGRTLPLEHEVDTAARTAQHHGTQTLLRQLRRRRRAPSSWFTRNVTIVADTTLVDVNDTANSGLSTGVQRVARNTATHWIDRGAQLVGWSATRTQLLPIDHDAFRARRPRGQRRPTPIVPWGGRYLLTETVNEPARSSRIAALAAHAPHTSGLIAYDAIPLTTAETTGPGMPGAFAKYLAAASRFTHAATISRAATIEYEGWKRMLASAGLDGPTLHTVPLVIEAPEPHGGDTQARAALWTPGHENEPLILSVGSHEPRKNHGAVLHAAETLWREGHRFTLAFIGGNAWGSEAFIGSIEQLRREGRPVTTLSGADDNILAWAYRLARYTVFPSLNEGYGLPVAESLAAGTPVITSNYGSMADIADRGGCLLIDPRDDADLTTAMRTLLTDDSELARLTAEARQQPTRTWADYADELWQALAT